MYSGDGVSEFVVHVVSMARNCICFVLCVGVGLIMYWIVLCFIGGEDF